MNNNNPLWRFSTNIYMKEGVSEILLHAQDKYSVDVNMILFAAWLASINRSLTETDIETAQKLVKLWRTGIIIPIRKIRKVVKKIPGTDFFYESIKKVEIDVEKEEVKILYNKFLELSTDQSSKLKLDLLEYNLEVFREINFVGEDELVLTQIKKTLATAMGVAKEVG